MALQINGTTVVNNSRALQNIASVDSTTAASITAAGVGGGGATSAEFGVTNTSGVPFGFVSSHTRYTKDLEPGGIVIARKYGNYNTTLYHRPSPTSTSGQITLASTSSSHFCYVNTTSSTYKVWLSWASEAWVFNF